MTGINRKNCQGQGPLSRPRPRPRTWIPRPRPRTWILALRTKAKAKD